MRPTTRLRLLVPTAATLCATLAAAPASASALPPKAAGLPAAATHTSVTHTSSTHAPATHAPVTRAPITAKPPTKERAVADARAAVRAHATAVRAAPGDTYAARGVVIDPDGSRHVRFDRTYRGLPVLGGDYVVHSAPDGAFRRATVAQSRPISVDLRPAVPATRAAELAARLVAKVQAAKAPAAHKPVLVVDAAAGTPALAWRVVGGGKTVILDARTGAVRRSFATDPSADTGTGHGLHSGDVVLGTSPAGDGFTLVDPARGALETRDAQNDPYPDPETSIAFTDPDNDWGDGTPADRASAAADIQYGAAEAWDYFRDTFGRSGPAGDGRAPLALAHAGVDEANAGWYGDCFCMEFGDGDPTVAAFTSLDVVAHEFSHGVTGATADLEYDGESGGLNEATSDIFGTLVEFAAANPVDPADYLVGEKLNDGGPGRPLRWMDDPAKDGKSLSCWAPSAGDVDVHYSSGIGNKFFYTLAVGSGSSQWGDSPVCGQAAAVTGIGNEAAGAIWYRALTVYMLTNTNFAAARQATLLAAADLYGEGSTEQSAVDAAWRAVNVDGSEPVPQAPAVTNPGHQYGSVGDNVHLQIKAVDPQGDPITFAAQDLPAGLSMDAAGLITGTLTTEGDGWTYVIVTVTDDSGNASTIYFFFDVSGPPLVTNPGDQTTAVDDFVFLTITVTDARAYSLTFASTGLPDGIYQYDKSLGGVPDRPGVYPVTFTATDETGLSTTIHFTWTVT